MRGKTPLKKSSSLPWKVEGGTVGRESREEKRGGAGGGVLAT